MKALFLTTISILVLGCATSGYKKANTQGSVNGYEEVKLSPTSFRVKYQGGTDSTMAIYQYFLRRSAELSKQNGFSFFTVSDNGTGQTVRGTEEFGRELKIPYYEGTITMHRESKPNAISAEEILVESSK